jgi:hypothetical protein
MILSSRTTFRYRSLNSLARIFIHWIIASYGPTLSKNAHMNLRVASLKNERVRSPYPTQNKSQARYCLVH